MFFARNFEKISLWITRVGLWLIPVLPVYISSTMLFPFITGKNFAFRIIVEIIFAFWVGLAVLKSEYRPRLTPLFKAVSIFIMIVFLADVFSLNPWRAFFANYERMEGFMMIFHLYLYFVVLVSVFKTRSHWSIFFFTTLGASLIVSFIALLQKFGYRVSLQGGFRVDSTIGNPTYLASYLVFHVWLVMIMLRRFWEKWWLRLIFLGLLFFELMIIYFTATRGAVLALLGIAVPFLIAIFWLWPRIFSPAIFWRKFVLAIAVVFILVPLTFWQLRNTDFIRNNPVLGRLTKYSLQERTIQSRFMIWGMAYKGVLSRPILGWGQENFYLVFQKYFNPGLYAQEPWFDRSHNIIFDWLVHAGFIGLASYLSILVTVFWALFSGMKKKTISLWEGIVISSLFITHFWQDIFVFDNLNTYLLFFAFLAYTQYLSVSPAFPVDTTGKTSAKVSGRSYFRAYSVTTALLVFLVIAGYFLHWKPIKESRALIRALSVIQFKGSMDQIINAFQKALNYNSFGNTEVREQMANFARTVPGSDRFNPEEQKKIVDFTLQELRKEIDNPAKDIKHMLFLAAVLSRAQSLDPNYGQEAEKVLREAIQLSSTKQIIYFELAQLYLSQGKLEQGVETLRRAWYLDKSFKDAGLNLWLVGLAAKKPEVVAEVKQFIKIKEVKNEEGLSRLGSLYQQQGDLAMTLEIVARLVETVPENPKYRFAYGSLLAYFGRKEEAVKQLEETLRLKPDSQEAKKLLEQLRPR